ncbi:hypothetical protein NQ318_019480 [Aromia moschata]|uniref:Uncharacterized protein n=1 Tax=Aromia moschata TaxID=1265417 RepID=A0AAV8X9R5_9CUCU|nr:hypothetical protein NQ318_019480 [Aromia moschata]
MRELHTQRPQKTNVWAGIIQDRIVGPFFFDDTLNGARYLRLLQHELMPGSADGRMLGLDVDVEEEDELTRTVPARRGRAPPDARSGSSARCRTWLPPRRRGAAWCRGTSCTSTATSWSAWCR